MTINVSVEEFKELLLQKYTNEQLAAKFNVGTTTIKRFKSNNNLVGIKTNEKPLTEKQLVHAQGLANQGYNVIEAAKAMNMAKQTLIKYIPAHLHGQFVSNGIASMANAKRKGTIEPFLNPSVQTAYMVGLFAADGCLSSRGYVSLSLLATDSDTLSQVAAYMRANISYTTNASGNAMGTVSVKDFTKVEAFKKATNILPNKTYNCYTIPNWIYYNEEYFTTFICGLFDGDGHCSPKRDKEVTLGITFHKNQYEFAKILSNFLDWGIYEHSTKDTIQIATSAKVKVERFSDFYLNCEFSMLRKVMKLEYLLSR